MQRPGYPPPPTPPAGPTERLAAPNEEPAPVKRKRRLLRDPLSILLICVIVFSLVIAGLIGAELYARHVANSKVAQAVACVVKDQATASFGVTPLMLWQQATKHYTNISVQTAGNQIRDAKGMKITININDVRLNSTANSKGTVGSLDATITWTTDGIKQSVQNAIPVLGPFVTNSVTAHPADGTIELKGMLDNITAKPVVSGNGLELQIVSFNALGFTMPKESVQSTLDDFTSNLTKNYPLGIHADSVQVTNSGVTSHFSTQNASIPNGNNNDPCFANL
jgi:LmeA-like phospholipid-binding